MKGSRVPLVGRIPARYRFKKKDLKPQVIRRIWCSICNHVIAEEISDLHQTAYEYWSITKDRLWVQGKWWGNSYICPYCGQAGKFPIDKPLTED